jgi:transketolase
VEHLASLRAMPNLVVLRPADANETAEAWRTALQRTAGPTALVLTRQNVPTLDREKLAPASGVGRGGYVLRDAPTGSPELILIASGSEVSLALAAAEKLEARGIPTRVVSLPSWALFQEQSSDYRNEVLPPTVRARVAVEAASPFGWERYVGVEGRVVGVADFGASAPADILGEKLGLTRDNVVRVALEVLRA